jgi:formylglycine-generating enzyme required for sulfatase activity
MHAEAFSYSRQTLAYPAAGARLAPAPSGLAAVAADVGATGDASIEGGLFQLGAEQGEGFVFDNEKWAHPVKVAPFALARRATSFAEYAAFVDEGGYAQRRWWSDEGWAWRTAAQADAPVYWRRKLGVQGWEVRCNEAWRPLVPDAPMLHVNAHEAEAWCRWAGRRLPSEAEWECAAAGGGSAPARRHPWGDTPPSRARANLWFPGGEGALAPVDAFAGGDSLQGCRQLTGNVWEWTASTFEPYPGFTPDPYREYSEPWFGSHRVLRGGCFATAASLYEMLTGDLPFATLDHSVRPKSVRASNPTVPEIIDRVLQIGLEADPGKRFQSASEFAAPIQRVLGAIERGSMRPVAPSAPEAMEVIPTLPPPSPALAGLVPQTERHPAGGARGATVRFGGHPGE